MVIDNVNPEFASSDSKHECTRTKTISSLPEVSTGMAAPHVVTFENRSISRTRMELVCTNDDKKVVFHLLHGQLNIFLVGNLYYSMLFHPTFVTKTIFMGTRRYGRLCRPTSGSCGGLQPRLFCPSGKNRACYAFLAHFWRFLVSSSNLGKF